MAMCRACNTAILSRNRTYCSNRCQVNYQYNRYVIAWKNGKQNGGRGIRTRAISKHIRRYLFEKYNAACSQCGWNKINPVLGITPLEIEHIDGNSENNQESNLILLCPNCHALTATYRNLNRGKGRVWRRIKYIKNTITPP